MGQAPDPVVFPDLAANLIYTVLCLVPGFLSLQTVSYVANVEEELTEFEQTTWSLIGSGVALSLTYFLYVAWMGAVTGRLVLVRPVELGWVGLVAIYPLLLFVALGLGFVAGIALSLTHRTAAVVGSVTSR